MIIIATGLAKLDEEISQKLTKKNKDSKIIGYREFFINKDISYDAIIISKRLPGDVPIEQLFFSFKDKVKRIIYITNQDDIDGVLCCFNLALYDFLFDPVSSDEILTCLENPHNFSDVNSIYLSFRQKKDELNELEDSLEKNEAPKAQSPEKIKIVEKKVVETRILKQNVITAYSADNNILASFILANSAIACSKRFNKILVIDNNFTPCLDHLLNVNKEIGVKDTFNVNTVDTGESACYSSIENKTFSPSLFKKFVIPCKNKKIDVLTGIYDDNLLSNMEQEHYKSIIDTSKKIYDEILVSVNPFKVNVGTMTSILESDKVLIVVENTYLSGRNTINALKTFERAGINRDNFGIIVVDHPSALESAISDKIFEEYTIITHLPFNKKYYNLINSKKPLVSSIFESKTEKKAYEKITSFIGISGSVFTEEVPENSNIDLENSTLNDTSEIKNHFILSLFKKFKERS